ncbi:GntR family transcriptional regulator [Rhodococcoides fascians A21d2]|uniref:GntR family transcriptional regulator n=1 Tax=Nocardiaceae TaxID=85025 RepID=UPI00050BF70C|nr:MULTISPECIES: GntR family transcriptional regulator [Rhodococcus]OZC51590.1 GntR family transcriptional regulator [Rhodococcus sp. WWJCD1]QIH99797.1 GntR family transcriptional regulator [Rhodococcus fascians A21d2]
MAEARHEFVARHLRSLIVSGEYAVGQSLPSESALCAQYEVSRGPVRQALATLSADGLVQLSQGRPAVVRSRDAAQTLDTFTPFSQWARRTGREAGSKTLEVSRRRASSSAVDALGIAPDDFVVEVVRVRYLDSEPTMIERSVFVDAVGSLLFDFDTDSGSITDYLTGRGVRFESMSHVLDAVSADSVDADSLGIAAGSPLLRERRTSRDETGTAFEYADDRYRSDQVVFSIVNSRTADPRMIASENSGT